GHVAGIHQLQQVCRFRKHKRFDVWEPVEQQLVSLPPNRIHFQASRSNNRQNRLLDPPGVLPMKGPLLQRREFLCEKGFGVGDVLIECAWKYLLQYVTVGGPAGSPQEHIDGSGSIASEVKLGSRAHETPRRRGAWH